MKARLIPFALLLLAPIVARSGRAQVRISGLAYMDYEYTITSPVPDQEGDNGFGYRRLYLTGDFTISEHFDARARLEASDRSTNADGKPAPFVKDLYLRWRDSFAEGHDIFFGISSPPSFTVSEEVWGYRSLEKTIQDRTGVVSSRDFGIAVRGRMNTRGTVRYGLMAANNSGTGAENNRDKRVYGQVELYPADHFVFTVGGDYASLSDDGESSALNGNAFAGYTSDRFAAGAEAFLNRVELEAVSDNTDTSGLSLFARVEVNENLTVVGRFDRVETTGPGVEVAESYFILGAAVRPHKNVEFIPNLWGSKLDDDDSPFVSGRLTLHFRF